MVHTFAASEMLVLHNALQQKSAANWPLAFLRTGFLMLTFSTAILASPCVHADFLFDLGNIAGGGNGSGQQLPGNAGYNGIDTETGNFVSGAKFGHTYYNGYNSVAASPFVDGVFILGGTQITSTGVANNLLSGDSSSVSFDYITNNREPGGSIPLKLNGVGYSSGIGICGGGGITFDIDAFRAASGMTEFKFDADFGTMSGADWKLRGYVVVSNESSVLADYFSPIMTSDLNPYVFSVDVPASARFLTLMVGIGGDGITDDHGGFAAARISAVPEPGAFILSALGTACFVARRRRN